MKLRFASEGDAEVLLSVYAQYIGTPVTFEARLPSLEEFRSRITSVTAVYPYLIAEEEGCPVGYAYAHRQMERAAYGWNAELSVYLDRNVLSGGIGKRLYGALCDVLCVQGVRNVYAGVTLPNARSEGLHAACGFRLIGIYRNTGFKNGRWHDVAWYEKQIAPYDVPPLPIRPVGAVKDSELKNILDKYSFR